MYSCTFFNGVGQRNTIFFVADGAFPLHRRIMKPFKPKPDKVLSNVENIFNYRQQSKAMCGERI